MCMHFSGPEGSFNTRELGNGRSNSVTSNVWKDLGTICKYVNHIREKRSCIRKKF
jgi:hypothetical protein